MSARSMLENLESRRLFSGLPLASIGDATVIEGNSGTKNVAVIVTLSQPRPNQPVTLSYGTQSGSAVAGSDFTSVSGKVTFAVGEVSKTIMLPLTGDRAVENDEYFVVNLQTSKSAKIADGQGVVTITDDEPRISIAGVSSDEGNTGTKAFNFTAMLSRAYDQAVTVNYATQNGSAITGMDYQAASGTVTFAAGETRKEIPVQVLGDRVGETDEYVYMNLSSASANAAISNTQASGAIIDNEPTITVSDAADYEGDTGTKGFVFSINLSRAYDQQVTVSYATADSTAFAGADYAATAGSFTFNPGEVTKTFTVQVMGNTTPEDTKLFLIQLSNVSSNAYVSNVAYGSIYDDDGYVGSPVDDGGGYYDWFDYVYYGW